MSDVKVASIVAKAEKVDLLRWHGEAAPADPEWLVKGLLPRRGTALLVGPWGYGKSFVLLDLAGAVMTKQTFAGRRVLRQGGVLWLAAEAAGGVPLRLAGLIKGKLGERDLFGGTPHKLPFCWTGDVPQLLDAGASALMKLVRHAEDEMRQRHSTELALIIVDTLAAAAGWRDENASAEALQAIGALQKLSEATGALVIASDHPGKKEELGARGSSAKEPGVDATLMLHGTRKTTGHVVDRRLSVRKQRDGEAGTEVSYRLDAVDMGKDRDGDPITTCVVAWELDRVRAKAQKASPRTQDILDKAIAACGGQPAVASEVRSAFIKLHGGKQNAARMAWNRAVEELGLKTDSDGRLNEVI